MVRYIYYLSEYKKEIVLHPASLRNLHKPLIATLLPFGVRGVLVFKSTDKALGGSGETVTVTVCSPASS